MALRLKLAKIKNDAQNAIYSLEEAQSGGTWLKGEKREAYQERELVKAQKLLARASDAIDAEVERVAL